MSESDFQPVDAGLVRMLIAILVYKYADEIYKLMQQLAGMTLSVNDKVSIYNTRNFLGETVFMKLEQTFINFNKNLPPEEEIDLVNIVSQAVYQYAIKKAPLPKIRLSESSIKTILNNVN